MRVTPALLKFFVAEIRNEDEGGVRPASLSSAWNSWDQAPEDVRAKWIGSDKLAMLRDVADEMRLLLDQYGPDLLLQECTDE